MATKKPNIKERTRIYGEVLSLNTATDRQAQEELAERRLSTSIRKDLNKTKRGSALLAAFPGGKYTMRRRWLDGGVPTYEARLLGDDRADLPFRPSKRTLTLYEADIQAARARRLMHGNVNSMRREVRMVLAKDPKLAARALLLADDIYAALVAPE